MLDVVDYTVLAYTVLLALLMQLSYNHEGKRYAAGKSEKIEESGAFRAFYNWIRFSQIPVVFLALYFGFLAVKISTNLQMIGVVLSLVSTATFVHAKGTLGKNYSPCYDSYMPPQVCKKGIYRFVRHPIYIANIVNFFAIFLYSGSYITLVNAVVLTIFYVKSARKEEAKLSVEFSEYAEYIKTSGMFFPKIFRTN